MNMNLNQTKLVGLTMQLDLKARDYKMLCEKLERLKENNIDANSTELLELRDMFQKNYNEIVEINGQIRELKTNEDVEGRKLQEQYNIDNLFKNKKKINTNNEELSMVVAKKKRFKKSNYSNET